MCAVPKAKLLDIRADDTRGSFENSREEHVFACCLEQRVCVSFIGDRTPGPMKARPDKILRPVFGGQYVEPERSLRRLCLSCK